MNPLTPLGTRTNYPPPPARPQAQPERSAHVADSVQLTSRQAAPAPPPTRAPEVREAARFPARHSWSTWPQAREALAGRLPEATLEVLDRTWAYAVDCHGDQMRPNHEPYPIHLLEVVEILVESGVRDCDILQAGMLHDVVEDTGHPLAEIRDRFGRGVSELVDWMTKPEPKPGQDPVAVRQGYLRQFEEAPLGAATVKLADRLSNVQRIHTYPSPDKRRAYYRETVEHVMPHAHRVPWFEEQFRDWKEAFANLA